MPITTVKTTAPITHTAKPVSKTICRALGESMSKKAMPTNVRSASMTNAVAQMATRCLCDGGILSLRDRPYRGSYCRFPCRARSALPAANCCSRAAIPSSCFCPFALRAGFSLPRAMRPLPRPRCFRAISRFRVPVLGRRADGEGCIFQPREVRGISLGRTVTQKYVSSRLDARFWLRYDTKICVQTQRRAFDAAPRVRPFYGSVTR